MSTRFSRHFAIVEIAAAGIVAAIVVAILFEYGVQRAVRCSVGPLAIVVPRLYSLCILTTTRPEFKMYYCIYVIGVVVGVLAAWSIVVAFPIAEPEWAYLVGVLLLGTVALARCVATFDIGRTGR